MKESIVFRHFVLMEKLMNFLFVKELYVKMNVKNHVQKNLIHFVVMMSVNTIYPKLSVAQQVAVLNGASNSPRIY